MAAHNKGTFIRDVIRYILREDNNVDEDSAVVVDVAEREGDQDFPIVVEEYGRRVLPGHNYSRVRFMTAAEYRAAVEETGDLMFNESFEVGDRFSTYWNYTAGGIISP